MECCDEYSFDCVWNDMEEQRLEFYLKSRQKIRVIDRKMLKGQPNENRTRTESYLDWMTRTRTVSGTTRRTRTLCRVPATSPVVDAPVCPLSTRSWTPWTGHWQKNFSTVAVTAWQQAATVRQRRRWYERVSRWWTPWDLPVPPSNFRHPTAPIYFNAASLTPTAGSRSNLLSVWWSAWHSTANQTVIPFISIASLTCKYLPKHWKPRNLHRRTQTSQIRDPNQFWYFREFLRNI